MQRRRAIATVSGEIRLPTSTRSSQAYVKKRIPETENLIRKSTRNLYLSSFGEPNAVHTRRTENSPK
jgi:hypothetical protein